MLARLLSVLAILSLLTAPMVAPSAAAMGDAPMTATEGMTSMAEGMPCCPPQKQPQPDCQQSCPLATLCLAKCFPNAPAASASTQAIFVSVALLPVWEDAARDLFSDPPLPRPPRT
jgi:hypothetical protein